MAKQVGQSMGDEIDHKLRTLRQAARQLRSVSSEAKNQVLKKAAELIEERGATLLVANRVDLDRLPGEASSAFRDRLTLNEKRLEQMAESLRQVAAFSDPVGEVVESKVLQNGLRVSRQRSPLGVIFMIFESRPNVAIEAFSLAFKAGNALILRGGKESSQSTGALYALLSDALDATGVSRACLWGVTDPDRQLVERLLQEKNRIDVVVPRGGEGLIEFVTSHSLIPVIKNDRGLCHVYVHSEADLGMAEQIILNAKTQRPGVCNAMETLLVDEKIAKTFLPRLHALLEPFDLIWHGCEKTAGILSGKSNVERAEKKNWDTEYLSLEMNCRVVRSLEEAIEHIEFHGSRHSEAILTQSEAIARRFQFEVDAAAVYWNASTRFTDGFELGLGGELGISTQKLHVRGPVGLRELTSVRWIMDGQGQVRT